MQWSSPRHADSRSTFVKIFQRPLCEKIDGKIYVVIYLVATLKILKISYLIDFDPLKMLWESTLLKMIWKYIIDPSSCQKLWLLDENCGLQYVLHTEKMVSWGAIFWKNHRRMQILGVHHKIKNVPWPHNMGYGWGQIRPLRSLWRFKAKNQFYSSSNIFLALNRHSDLGGRIWPHPYPILWGQGTFFI